MEILVKNGYSKGVEEMKWIIKRDENNQIYERVLEGTDVVIKREWSSSLGAYESWNNLFKGDRFVLSTAPGSGYTLKDLKAMGEAMK